MVKPPPNQSPLKDRRLGAHPDTAPERGSVSRRNVRTFSRPLNPHGALGKAHPALKIKLLEQLCLDLTGKLRQADR